MLNCDSASTASQFLQEKTMFANDVRFTKTDKLKGRKKGEGKTL